MRTFRIVVSEEAKTDIDELFEFIVNEYKSETTANKYIYELTHAIKKLSYSAESYRIQRGRFFEKYDKNARRINYKKMAIIYTIHNQHVLVRRIVSQSIISD